MGAVFQPASLTTLEKVVQSKSVIWSSPRILPQLSSLVDVSINLLRGIIPPTSVPETASGLSFVVGSIALVGDLASVEAVH